MKCLQKTENKSFKIRLAKEVLKHIQNITRGKKNQQLKCHSNEKLLFCCKYYYFGNENSSKL